MWVTVPVALQFLGLMSATLPAALLMGWFGRKLGFLLAISLAWVAHSWPYGRFIGEKFALFLFKHHLAGGGHWRGAAISLCGGGAVPATSSTLAISWVMGGGVLAAFGEFSGMG